MSNRTSSSSGIRVLNSLTCCSGTRFGSHMSRNTAICTAICLWQSYTIFSIAGFFVELAVFASIAKAALVRRHANSWNSMKLIFSIENLLISNPSYLFLACIFDLAKQICTVCSDITQSFNVGIWRGGVFFFFELICFLTGLNAESGRARHIEWH